MVVNLFLWGLTAAMALVILIDTVRYLIPNTLNLAIFAMWVAAIFLLPIHGVPLALAAGVLVLLVGLGIFAIGLMGGGDIKLLAVLTLWTGWGTPTAQFLILTAIVGGVLVVVTLIVRALASALAGEKSLPRFLTRKQPVPYGIAIAGAFLIMLWRGQVPALG